MSGDTGWIYWDEAGVATGPLGLDEVVGLVRQGKIGPSTDMRRPTEAAWTPAVTLLPDLFPAHPAMSEIAQGWIDVRPHPWRRYLARMFDSLVVGSITWMLLATIFFSIAPATAAAAFRVFSVPGGQFLDIILTQIVIMPFNALTIGLTGLTLGKWIFGVKVVKDGRPIGFPAAFRREASIFLFGLAFGVPFASLFTLVGSYNDLKDNRVTRWDKAAKLTVVHRPQSTLATAGMIAGGIVFIIVRVGLTMLSRLPR